MTADPCPTCKGRCCVNKHGASFATLAEWCRTRIGQVMVCENEGATWLPFEPFLAIKGNESRHGGKVSREAIWTNWDEDDAIERGEHRREEEP